MLLSNIKMKNPITNNEKRKIEKRFETELGEEIEEELRIMENEITKNKGGAKLNNTNARKDPSKRLSHQLTLYITENSRDNWIKLADEAGMTVNKLITNKMNNGI